MKNLFGFAVVITALLILSFGCQKSDSSDKIELLGAGASFPYPLYDTMFKEYNKSKGVQINYQPKGSGNGIKQLTDKMVNFGATDAPMKEEDFTNAGAEIIHIPTTIGAVTVVFNLEAKPEIGLLSEVEIKLTGEVLAQIFMGKVAKWNDEMIKTLNPDAKLPDLKITIIRRADKSGTSFIFTDYLSTISQDFEKTVGRNKMPNWPKDSLGGKQNAGVTDLVKRTLGAIGYVELAFALEQKLAVAQIKNKSGNYIKPSVESVSLSADVEIPEHTRVSIVNTAAEKGYPITSFTWLILYKEQKYNDKMTEVTAKAVIDLIWWMIHDGQVNCAPLTYAPLPKAVQLKAEALLKSVTFDGKSVMK